MQNGLLVEEPAETSNVNPFIDLGKRAIMARIIDAAKGV
jgi:hypothetical protein